MFTLKGQTHMLWWHIECRNTNNWSRPISDWIPRFITCNARITGRAQRWLRKVCSFVFSNKETSRYRLSVGYYALQSKPHSARMHSEPSSPPCPSLDVISKDKLLLLLFSLVCSPFCRTIGSSCVNRRAKELSNPWKSQSRWLQRLKNGPRSIYPNRSIR